MDCETRWDSELALIERVVYFDAEILQLYAIPRLGIDASCILSRYEFDLVFAITLVLEPFREFTKFSHILKVEMLEKGSRALKIAHDDRNRRLDEIYLPCEFFRL